MKKWQIRERVLLGGKGSGHHGHKGIPGHRGGSAPSKGGGLSGWTVLDKKRLGPGNIAYIQGDPEGKHTEITYKPKDRWRTEDQYVVQTFSKGVPTKLTNRTYATEEAALAAAKEWKDYKGKWAETGTIDREYFKTGPGKRMIPSYVDKDVRNAIQDQLVEHSTPLDHLAKIRYITTRLDEGESLDADGNILMRRGTTAFAYFSPRQGGKIVISPAMAGGLKRGSDYSRLALFHEVGHHVHLRAPKSISRLDARIGSLYGKLSSQHIRTLGKYGIRSYSMTNQRELFADLYTNYVRAPKLRPAITELMASANIDMLVIMEGYK